MNKRILKVNSEIQKSISEIISMELKDPNISGLITVTKVDTSADLSNAKVYLSIFAVSDRDKVFNEILHSARFIRKMLSQKLNLRITPYLDFRLDTSFDEGYKIDKLIEKAKNQRGEYEV